MNKTEQDSMMGAGAGNGVGRGLAVSDLVAWGSFSVELTPGET